MIKRITLWIFSICFSLNGFAQNGDKLGVTSLSKSRRLALVIGNLKYANGIRRLVNTERDVDSVSVKLQKVGFKVFDYKNLDLSKTQQVITQFLAELDKGNVEAALVYFTGHGIGFGQTNYLLPVDTHLSCIEDLKSYESVSLNTLVESVLTKSIKNNLFFIDACRGLGELKGCLGSPIGQNWQGLAKPSESYRGSLIAFATREGNTADDNTYDSVNSLFTSELIKYITVPNLNVEKILKLTNQGVFKRSGGKQDPVRWDHSLDDFFFIQTTPPPPPPPPFRRIDVVAYKPNGNAIDMGLAKMVVQELKKKYPDYEIQPQATSKNALMQDIICTVTRKTSTDKNPIEVDNKTYDLVKADTELTLIFKGNATVSDQVELSEGGIDHQQSIAIQNSIERAVSQLKETTIVLPSPTKPFK